MCFVLPIDFKSFALPRDDYDKEVKQAKEQQRRRHTTTPRRPRRPDLQVYHPRSRRECNSPFIQHLNEKITSMELTGFAPLGTFCRWIWAGGRCRGWGVERQRVEHRDRDAWNRTILVGLSGRLWCCHLLSCAQGQNTRLFFSLNLV